MTTITIPSLVCSIGDRAFSSCNRLAKVTIPGSIKALGKGVFSGCKSLSKLKFVGELQNFKLVDEVLFDKEMIRLIWCSRKKGGEYEIPNTTTIIDSGAFTGNEKLK